MTGSIALHGGGEFLPGDERFLAALLDAAPTRSGAIRVAVVPTAAARGRPDLSGSHGVAGFERLGRDLGRPLQATIVTIIDQPSADDEAVAAALSIADVIHLPGGDPDIIPTLYPGTRAWAAMRDALARDAVLAGASAGAMALASWTWTPDGGVPGLAVIPRLVVMPHATEASFAAAVERYRSIAPPGVDALGIAERTGVIGPPGGPWRVVGEGRVYWLASAHRTPVVLGDGERLERR